jgi:hypothetical protein
MACNPYHARIDITASGNQQLNYMLNSILITVGGPKTRVRGYVFDR